MHFGIANPRWRGKRSRHSRRMRNPQFYISGKRPMGNWVTATVIICTMLQDLTCIKPVACEYKYTKRWLLSIKISKLMHSYFFIVDNIFIFASWGNITMTGKMFPVSIQNTINLGIITAVENEMEIFSTTYSWIVESDNWTETGWCSVLPLNWGGMICQMCLNGEYLIINHWQI